MGIGDEAEHDVWFSSSQLPFLVLLLHRCETCGSTDVRRGAQCGGHVALIAELLSEDKMNQYSTVPENPTIFSHTCGKSGSSAIDPKGPVGSGGVSSTLSPVNSSSKYRVSVSDVTCGLKGGVICKYIRCY